MASLTFLSANVTQSFSVSQIGNSAFLLSVVGGDPTAVTITIAGGTVSVTAQHAGFTMIVVTGAGGKFASVPVSITTTTFTIK